MVCLLYSIPQLSCIYSSLEQTSSWNLLEQETISFLWPVDFGIWAKKCIWVSNAISWSHFRLLQLYSLSKFFNPGRSLPSCYLIYIFYLLFPISFSFLHCIQWTDQKKSLCWNDNDSNVHSLYCNFKIINRDFYNRRDLSTHKSSKLISYLYSTFIGIVLEFNVYFKQLLHKIPFNQSLFSISNYYW